MFATSRILQCSAVVCVLTGLAAAQAPASNEIVANQNRTPAGKLENGVLNVQLELRSGEWRPEADDGPQLFVQAFGEVGHAAQIPGPVLRMAAGTTVHVTIANRLKMKATVYGLNTRPGDTRAGIEVAPGDSRELTFMAGMPGTYYYWARTTSPEDGLVGIGGAGLQPYLADAQLNGAYVVDPPGAVPADRILLMNLMLVLPDALHDFVEVVSINGKSYPYTEPLEYTEGETIRWRVINTTAFEHPMHLHGAFYKLLSLGDYESDTAFAEADRQSIVTETLMGGHTMMMEWKPEHVGRWLFHCHFQAHMSVDKRVPVLSTKESPRYNPAAGAVAAHEHPGSMGPMNDMAGLVMMTTVKPAPGSVPASSASTSAHKFDLVIEPTEVSGKSPTFSCSVREGKKIVASAEKSMGPPIVVTRGEATEITVTNHLREATTIHWHGLELDSYYDGVAGGGVGNQITPTIAPGGSFVAHFTPNRAGTFIYHTHAADPDQLTGGVYGAIIVLEPGERFDAEHDRLMVLGARDANFFTTRMTLNGEEAPSPMVLTRGVQYRLRLINMGPDLAADFHLGSKERPAMWHAIAKDGATLPLRLAQTGDAALHLDSGETYDFEFQPAVPGEIPWQVENIVNQAKLVGKILVQ